MQAEVRMGVNSGQMIPDRFWHLLVYIGTIAWTSYLFATGSVLPFCQSAKRVDGRRPASEPEWRQHGN